LKTFQLCNSDILVVIRNNQIISSRGAIYWLIKMIVEK
jgi:hypothetical protein